MLGDVLPSHVSTADAEIGCSHASNSRSAAFSRQAVAANVIVMTCGFVLMGYQLTGWFAA